MIDFERTVELMAEYVAAEYDHVLDDVRIKEVCGNIATCTATPCEETEDPPYDFEIEYLGKFAGHEMVCLSKQFVLCARPDVLVEVLVNL